MISCFVIPTANSYSNRARSSPEVVFFSRWVWHPISVSKLVKDQGVQADNMFSLSALCTEAANKVIFMKRRSFQDFSKSAFIS